MENFFCTELSRNANESLIGTASTHCIYVLVECPPPWTPEIQASKYLPEPLRQLIQEAHATRRAKFLLIADEQTQPNSPSQVIIFQKQAGLSQGYAKQELCVHHLDQVAPLVRAYLDVADAAALGDTADAPQVDHWNVAEIQPHQTPCPIPCPTSDPRHFLVCTHGSHDRCCSRYGYPFYRQAKLILQQLGLAHHRVWQVSHIGGHRFAPTLIDFPEGRYYGGLDQQSFLSILQRCGSVDCLRQVYRGWGLLPKSAQILEQELILQQGWAWFQHQVSARIVRTFPDQGVIQVELTCRQLKGETILYRANIVEDQTQTLYLPGSCGSDKISQFVKYRIKNLSSTSLINSLTNSLPNSLKNLAS